MSKEITNNIPSCGPLRTIISFHHEDTDDPDYGLYILEIKIFDASRLIRQETIVTDKLNIFDDDKKDEGADQFREVTKKIERQKNEPLTWNELKTMKSKPVWVEADDGKYKKWFIVGNFFSWFEKEDFDAHVNLYHYGSATEMSKEMYGFYWQAYRKERE